MSDLLENGVEDTGFLHLSQMRDQLQVCEAEEAAFKQYRDDLVLDENFHSYTTRYSRILKYDYTHPGQFKLNPGSHAHPRAEYLIQYDNKVRKPTYASKLIDFDLALLEFYLEEGEQYALALDQFRVLADQGKVSPTTSGIHQDGEDSLFIHFIESSNAQPILSTLYGGNSEEETILQRPLGSFLELLFVNDSKLFHNAEPVVQVSP